MMQSCHDALAARHADVPATMHTRMVTIAPLYMTLQLHAEAIAHTMIVR